MLVSSVAGCRAWNGQFHGEPGEGGDCEHMRDQLDAAESLVMQPETVYLCNVWAVHESIPVERDMRRSLVRISLPETAIVQ